jgi:hypothetical protein
MGTFCSSNSFIADEAVFLNDEILVNTLATETMTTDSSLTLVDEFKAERTD